MNMNLLCRINYSKTMSIMHPSPYKCQYFKLFAEKKFRKGFLPEAEGKLPEAGPFLRRKWIDAVL